MYPKGDAGILSALNNFWHLPLMFLFAGTSILLFLIKSVASLGSKEGDKEDTANHFGSLAGSFADLIKEIIGLIKK